MLRPGATGARVRTGKPAGHCAKMEPPPMMIVITTMKTSQ